MKIIDFGVGKTSWYDSRQPTSDHLLASWTNRHLSDKIQPEHLRAPEVYLGAPWGKAVDIWSLGCLVRMDCREMHSWMLQTTTWLIALSGHRDR